MALVHERQPDYSPQCRILHFEIFRTPANVLFDGLEKVIAHGVLAASCGSTFSVARSSLAGCQRQWSRMQPWLETSGGSLGAEAFIVSRCVPCAVK
jgi:hypothetical protein